MISYDSVNEYLNSIELPKTIEEVLDYEYKLEEKERVFLNSANNFLRSYEDYDSYRLQSAHCLGTCLTNLTRIGMYILLENEIVFVNTSNLKEASEGFDWQVAHYPFSRIDELNMEMMEEDVSEYNAGVLYIKLLDDKGKRRTHVFRHFNPEHFQCFKDFHSNKIFPKYCRAPEQ